MSVRWGILTIFICLILSSCVTKRNLIYLNQIQQNDTILSIKPKNLDFRIHPGVNLYISFYHANKEVVELLNAGNQAASSSRLSKSGIYYTSFYVNDSGYVYLPVLGSVQLNNLSVQQAEDKISGLINQIFQDTYVTLKLNERTFTLLGEFFSPGTYEFNRDYISLFHAIGMAGDITDYGNRAHVKIIRRTGSGLVISYVDLTDPKFVQSPYYYVQNEDVIYVEPLNAKTFQTRTFPISSILSIVTSVLVLYSFAAGK